MKFQPLARTLVLNCLWLSCALLISCSQPEITYYEVPKEESESLPPDHPPMGSEAENPPRMSDPSMADRIAPPDLSEGTGLVWQAPETWMEGRASSVRLGSYTVPDSDLDISVTRFPGDVGGLLSNVNRWRGQIGLKPTTLPEIESSLRSLSTPNFEFQIVDLLNEETRQGMKVALLDFEGNTWFFKMTGSNSAIEQQESAFINLLETVQVD